MVMNEQSDIFIDNLTKKSKSKKIFDICPFISNCALDIICGNYQLIISFYKIYSKLIFKKLQWYYNNFIIC